MFYRILLDIHAYAMSGAMLVFASGELVLIPARRGRLVPARTALSLSRLASVLTSVGILAGISIFFLGRWPLSTPWLIASFLLIAVLMVVDKKIVQPWRVRAKSLFNDGASGAQIRMMARDRRALFGRISVIALFGLVVALMSVKPALPLP